MKSHPDVVILQFGANDAKPEFWDSSKFITDYVDMIKLFRHLNSTPDIYVMIPPPIYKEGWGIKMEILNKEIPKLVMPKIASLTSTRLINVFSMLGGDSNIVNEYYYNNTQTGSLNDGLHLTELGYEKIAIMVGYELVINNSYNKHLSHSTRIHLRKSLERYATSV